MTFRSLNEFQKRLEPDSIPTGLHYLIIKLIIRQNSFYDLKQVNWRTKQKKQNGRLRRRLEVDERYLSNFESKEIKAS